MKKVGIITINTNDNYGNRLQNYALQCFIEKYGFNVETIRNSTHGIKKKNNINTIKKIIYGLRSILSKMKRIINQNQKCVKIRKNNFELFDKKYVKYTNYTINNNNIPQNLGKEYDYFVIGSDQVWNPNFGRMSSIEFGLFAPKENVVAYAASFGVNEIDPDLNIFFKQGLENINYISVREERGKELVKELSNRESIVVLDPTLLLSRKEWESVISEPIYKPTKKYILTYFLGKISTDRENQLKKIANDNNFEIVNLSKIQYKQYYIAGPSEFLWYIKNAEIIFTDSFHGSVFSIIFDKTFYVMEREDKTISMNSRIDTLLNLFKLKDRKFENWEKLSMEHNYSHVDSILQKEKIKSKEFLELALSVKKI